MIVEKENVYLKLQIKTVQIDRGKKIIPVRKLSHNKTEHKTEYYSTDIILLVWILIQKMYILSHLLFHQYIDQLSL